MARLARAVFPGLPHHVTQRGNRRERVFFEDGDYVAYLDLISAAAKRAGTAIWSYCLMPNHVHFIMAPSTADGLRDTFAEAHRRYTARIHRRFEWTGHLWQGRFSSVAMDDDHMLAAARYVPMNPVRAGMVARPEDWRWSSARAHLSGEDDGIVSVAPLAAWIDDFPAFFGHPEDEAVLGALLRSASTGRPVGAADWIADLERTTDRVLARQPPGRRPKGKRETDGDGLFHTVSP
jgi:putative transposase